MKCLRDLMCLIVRLFGRGSSPLKSFETPIIGRCTNPHPRSPMVVAKPALGPKHACVSFFVDQSFGRSVLKAQYVCSPGGFALVTEILFDGKVECAECASILGLDKLRFS